MKALTLRPHWAWFVINAYKDIENRSWPTRWIHASSSRVTRAEYERFLAIRHERRIKKFPVREDFLTGGAEIVDCVTKSQSFWFGGEYGFVLRNARKTKFKATKGRLGFFFDVALGQQT